MGNLLLSGLAVPRTAAIVLASGKLFTIAGLADTSSTSNSGSFTYEASGRAGNISNTESGTQVTGIFFGGGKAGTFTTPSTVVQAGGVFAGGGSLARPTSSSGNEFKGTGKFFGSGKVGSVTSPQGGSPSVGFSYEGSGLLGTVQASNQDVGQEDNPPGHRHDSDEVINGLHYHFEDFIRCCDRPPLIDCCGCNGPDDDNLMPTIWQIETVPHMYGAVLFPGPLIGSPTDWKFAHGCENFDDEDVRRVELYHGPYNAYPEHRGNCFWGTLAENVGQGKCCELGCGEEDTTFGHGGPETWHPAISSYMGCYMYDEVPPVDPIYYWYAEGMTELYCADSEWSAEDCLLYDEQTTGPCHACGDLAPMADEASCEATKAYLESLGYVVGDCYRAEADPGSPGWPAYVSHIAGFGGPCGCSRSYIFLNPDDYACRTLLEDMSDTMGSDLPEFQCNDCNTYVLYKYRPEGETNPHCLSCLDNGADQGCQCGYDAWGFYSFGYGCCGQPATITICPASYRDGYSDSDASDCNPDVLCCKEIAEEGLGMAPMALAMAAPPANSLHFEFLGTSSTGYLIAGDDGKYRGGLPPISLVVDKQAKTLNGKPLSMLSEELFWGRARIGSDVVGFTIEVSE
ncbi:MAG: hypothetical protein QM703_22705 [Gemmatales bacterium]